MRYVLVALLLAGCAASPDEVKRDGTQLKGIAPRPPEITVRCLQDSWESQSGESVGQVIPLKTAGGYELRIRQMQFGVITVYQLTPLADGRTLVRAWHRDGFVTNVDQKTLDTQLGNCRG